MLALHVNGQSVKSVAGVNFFTHKSEAVKQLKNRFGTPFEERSDELEYLEIQLGGVFYTFASFYFDHGLFVGAKFSNYYNTAEEAKRQRDKIAEVYSEKYHIYSTTTDDAGFKAYRFGSLDEESYYPIVIDIVKGKSRGGDTHYYVEVWYYMNRIMKLSQSEI